MKTFLENLAAILGPVTLAFLVATYVHEFGYYFVIGRHFQALLSTTDYFANAILWLPLAVIGWWWFDWKAIYRQDYYRKIGKQWQTWVLPAFFIILFSLGFFFTFEGFYIGLFFPLAYVWLAYIAPLIPHSDHADEFVRRLRFGLIAFPVTVGVLFFIGVSSGDYDLKRVGDVYLIHKKQSEAVPRLILRNLDKGILVRDVVNQRIEFIRWDEVSRVTRIAPSSPNVPLACMLFGLNCKNPPAP